MLALEATSDELRKYDVVTEYLRPYAGPQCYAHLDKDGSDYRVAVSDAFVEQRVSGAEGRAAPRPLAETLASRECWRCCDCCGKWRFVDRRCAPALQGDTFFQERETDLDWATWLAQAPARYAAAEREWRGPEAEAYKCGDGGGVAAGSGAEVGAAGCRG